MTEHSTDARQRDRDTVVAATLVHVPFDGWSKKALATGIKDAGLAKETALRLFPGGMSEVADHFADWSDRRMLEALAELDLDGMRIRDRIHACVKTRLVVNAPYREAIRRLASYLALPPNGPLAARLAWRSASVMWYAAGDTATDWNYYSKRGLLVTVYTSTLLCWLADDGDGEGDYPETWEFLERRIDDVLRTFGFPRRLKERLAGMTPRRWKKAS